MLAGGSHALTIGRYVVDLNIGFRDTKGRICVPFIVYRLDDGLVIYDGTLCIRHKGDGEHTAAVVPSSFALTGEVVSS